jgi:beta-lactamase class A
MKTTFLILLAALLIPASVTSQSDQLEHLRNEITRLEQLSGGTVGVGIIHLESGTELMYNNDQHFPMASSYKVPVAVQLLRKVEAGEMRLDSMVILTEKDIHPGSGTISRLLDDPGVALSALNLMELMMLISDNSATDLCMRLAGGPDAINAMMKNKGIEGISVDRPTVALICNWLGIDLEADENMSMLEFMKAVEEVSEERKVKAAKAFSEDLRDQSTPEGMARLLQKIWKGELLNKKHTELLLDIMYRCETGEGRLKGLLPPDVSVAHKTGTIGGTTNDVGIIDLPGEAGHAVIVVFVKESDIPVAERERAIAHIARAVYDYFLFAGRD